MTQYEYQMLRDITLKTIRLVRSAVLKDHTSEIFQEYVIEYGQKKLVTLRHRYYRTLH